MEAAQHLDRADVRPCVVDDALAAVFDEVLQQLEGLRSLPILSEKKMSLVEDWPHLVDLSPLSGFLLHEAGVDGGHDLVKVLTTGNVLA